jgi:hypothetical protein
VVEYVLCTPYQVPKKGSITNLEKAKSKQETGQREKERINWVTGLGHHAVCLSDASCNVYAATLCSMYDQSVARVCGYLDLMEIMMKSPFHELVPATERVASTAEP